MRFTSPIKYTYPNEGQLLFTTTFSGMVFFSKLIGKAIKYTPYLYTAYLLARTFLNPHSNAFIWLGDILLIAYSIHLFVRFLQGFIIQLKRQHKLLWLPLFLLLSTYLFALPLWLIWTGAALIFPHLSNDTISHASFTLILTFCIYYCNPLSIFLRQ